MTFCIDFGEWAAQLPAHVCDTCQMPRLMRSRTTYESGSVKLSAARRADNAMTRELFAAEATV